MRPFRFLFSFFFFLFSWSLSYAQSTSFDCYTILVGKDASADGSVILAHNEDDGGEQIVNIYKVPSIKHKENERISFKNGGSIPQVERTNSFIWFQLPGMEVSDGFVNQYGVAVASNGCPSMETEPELTDGGVVYWIRRLIGERAKSARQAVKLAGKMIDEFGYASSGRTYSIADRKEAWMLAVVNGKHWVAQRVPDDKIAIIPNYYTIGAVNLADTLNFLGSPDIVDYAIEKGWYEPEKDGAFHFAKAYTKRSSIDHPGNVNRKWRGLDLLAKEKYELNDDFPFAVEPKQKVSLAMIKAVLRDHYEGTELDKTDGFKLGSPHGLSDATICSGSTQYSIIVELRNKMPLEIGTRVWTAIFRPGVNAYTPLYLGMLEIPRTYALTDYASAMKIHFEPAESVFDTVDTHRYWTHVKATEAVDSNYLEHIKKAREKRDQLEKSVLKKAKKVEKEAMSIYKKDRDAARRMLTDFSIVWMDKAYEYAKELRQGN